MSKEFKSSTGEIQLDGGSKVKYQIKKTGMVMQPVSLTFTAFKADGTPTDSLETDSTLYFDAKGEIVDRAPMNMVTNALKLKDLYRAKFAEHLDMFGAEGNQEKALIAGFLLPGEAGIARRSEIVSGNVRRVLNKQDI